MRASHVLGIDIGTTAVKALALDLAHGRWQAVESPPLALHTEHAGWAEVDPSDWQRAVESCLGQLREQLGTFDGIGAVGVCGMVPATVLLDETGTPLRRSIQQNDARTGAEVALISRTLGAERAFERTGSVPNTQQVLPKLLWLRAHQPETLARARRVVGSYDLVRSWLTGDLVVEANWALEGGLWDLHERTWWHEALTTFDIPPSWLGPVSMPWEVVGEVATAWGEELGLRRGTPVVAGSADHVASALAAGIVEPGQTLIKFGGAGDILYASATPLLHPRLYFDLHDLPGRYLLNGCMASSGSLVRWMLERTKHASSELAHLDDEAAGLPPGSGGLVILPYFLGEKTPLFDPAARGIVFGLGLHHGDAHLFRATLESVMYGFRHHLDVLSEAGLPVHEVRATNGGARSRLWRQIAADVLGRPVHAYPHHPGSALGAALVAALGTGLATDPGKLAVARLDGRIHEPNPAATARYDELYHVYRSLYERNRDLFAIVAREEQP